LNQVVVSQATAQENTQKRATILFHNDRAVSDLFSEELENEIAYVLSLRAAASSMIRLHHRQSSSFALDCNLSFLVAMLQMPRATKMR
jgi:hypothetical protein